MTFSRHSSRVYMDEYDLDGAINVLRQRIQEQDDDLPYYQGAHLALNIIRNHDHIESQREFMLAFDAVLNRREN